MAYETKLIETYPGFGPTIVTDGTMETDPLGNWTAGGGAGLAIGTVAAADPVRNGCQSLEVTDGGAGGGYAYQNVTVEPGKRYKVEVWGYAAVIADTWRVRICTTAPAPYWTGPVHTVLVSVIWDSDEKFFRVPDGVTSIQIWLEVEGAAKVIYFDDVSVRMEAPVPMAEIDLMFRATDDWSLWQQGIRINDPRIVEIWGGEMEDQLVRREEGTRVIPMELNLEAADADTLIDDVNKLEEMLRQATTYRKHRTGGEVFLQFKIHDATHSVWYPVICGQIDKTALMKICGSEKLIDKVPVVIVCEAYWESLDTYDLENLLDNPGFEEWNAGICNSQPDCWTDYQTAGATGENNQETEVVEEGCEALRIELAATPAGQYQGVTQNLGGLLRFDTEYTLLAWVQNEALTNGKVYIFVEGAAAAIRGTAINDGLARTDYTLVSCQFTPLIGDIAANVHIRVRLEAVGGACTGQARIDKMLVMQSSQVPIGWMSSSYLTNHYDRDANEVNFLSVIDIPGEVEAEASYTIVPSETYAHFYLAQRTQADPCRFIWQLLPCDAYTEDESGGAPCVPVLKDAACKDSDKVADPNSPCTCRIQCDFAVVQPMALRAYWSITADLKDYYGNFVLGVLAAASGATDTIKMQIQTCNDLCAIWSQGLRVTDTVAQVVGAGWWLYDKWSLFTFPLGEHRRGLWDPANEWQIRLYASSTGTTDSLWIAGVYLIPVDDAFMISGHSGVAFALGEHLTISDLDGDVGAFPRLLAPPRGQYYDAIGPVGKIPLLKPRIANQLHFIQASAGPWITIPDAFKVSLKYRPRGIFLRGANP